MSVFDSPGLYARNPEGGVESIPEYLEAGFKWYAFNVGDHAESEWQVVIDYARREGMAIFPWARTWDNQKVIDLCAIGRRYENRVLVNCETELGKATTPECIRDQTQGMDACISGEAWAPNDVDYAPIKHIPIHLQLFPQENDTSRHPRDCRAHYYVDKGCEKVLWMPGIHGLGSITYFPCLQGGYGVYTVDDMEGMYSTWSPRAINPLAASSFPKVTPGYGPNSPNGKPQSKPSWAWKSLKRVMHNAGFGNFGNPDDAYNKALVAAMQRFQRWAGLSATGDYGTGSYEAIRTLWDANAVMYGTSSYAADDVAQNWMRLALA